MAEALTYEKVWEMFQEMSRETDRRMRESREQMQESDREIREQMRETDRMIGELGNRFGELAEHLVAPSINEKFKDFGFTFEEISRDKTIKDSSGKFLAEIDILLENGDVVIAVEVKAKPVEKDVEKHITRMEILRHRADLRKDTRKFQGAIAGAIMNDEIRRHINKAGFYAIEQTGDTVKISVPEGFVPKQW